MPKHYKQLTGEDRDLLSLLKAQKKSLREIAVLLGRSPGTLSRELKRNGSPSGRGSYLPHLAQERAQQRKRKGHQRQRLRDLQLRAYVRQRLRRGWSPERIAGRWKLLGRSRISHEAIYQWIYAEAHELVCHLPRAHRKRLPRGHSSRHKVFFIPSRIPVRDRPKIIERRSQAGHWEVDTVLGRRALTSLQILVERKTRYVRLKKLSVRTAVEMARVLKRSLACYPKQMRRTLTYDNGRENVHHLSVNETLGTKSYFCEPMHSWEKGSVENAAGLVRRRLPKKTDFAMVSKGRVKSIERWLNGLPRKCLGFKTAAEAFRRSVALTC